MAEPEGASDPLMDGEQPEMLPQETLSGEQEMTPAEELPEESEAPTSPEPHAEAAAPTEEPSPEAPQAAEPADDERMRAAGADADEPAPATDVEATLTEEVPPPVAAADTPEEKHGMSEAGEAAEEAAATPPPEAAKPAAEKEKESAAEEQPAAREAASDGEPTAEPAAAEVGVEGEAVGVEDEANAGSGGGKKSSKKASSKSGSKKGKKAKSDPSEAAFRKKEPASQASRGGDESTEPMAEVAEAATAALAAQEAEPMVMGGWDDAGGGSGNTDDAFAAGAGLHGARDDEIDLMAAAAAARSVTPAGGGDSEFVAVEGAAGITQQLLDVFNSTNGGDAAPLTAVVAALQRSESMAAMAQQPARIRVVGGGVEPRQETFQQVLMDLESKGSVMVTAQQLLAYLGNPSNVVIATAAEPPVPAAAQSEEKAAPAAPKEKKEKAEKKSGRSTGRSSKSTVAVAAAKAPAAPIGPRAAKAAAEEAARKEKVAEAARKAEAAAANLLGAVDPQEDEMEKQMEEEGVMAEVQQVLAAALDGAAKLVVVGGAGAAEGKRSVFRVWPTLWQQSTDAVGAAGGTERELFEATHGSDYLLNDMKVLDVGSLHWSKPETAGMMEPPRAHHSVCFQPTRIQAVPVLDDTMAAASTAARPSGIMEPYLYDGAVNLRLLYRHAALMVEPERSAAFGGVALGRVLSSALLNSFASAFLPRFHDGLLPYEFLRDLVHTLYYPGAAEEERMARTLMADYKGEARTLATWLLERMDRLYSPRADGCRPLKGLRHLLAGDHYLMSTFLQQVQRAAARPSGSPTALVLQVDQVELLDTFASAIDSVWAEIDVEAAPHLLSASARREVPPVQKQVPTARVTLRIDHAVSLAVTPEELRREQEDAAINERFPVTTGGLLALEPPQPQPAAAGGDSDAPLPPLANDTYAPTAVLAAAVMPRQDDPEAPALQELLEAMLKRQESALVTVVVKGSKVGMKLRGMEKDAEVEIGYCQVDLLDLLDGGGNLYGEWLELRSPALRASASTSEMTQKIGRVQVGMQATHALRMVSHVAKKAYMDAFKLVVFGGLTSVAPNADKAAEEKQGGQAEVSTTAATAAALLGVHAQETAVNVLRPCNSVALYNAAVNRWEALETAGAPPEPRWAHSACTVRNRMWVYGGTNGTMALPDLAVLDLDSLSWSAHNPRNARGDVGPVGRFHHACQVLAGWGPAGIGHALLVHGGRHCAPGKADRVLDDVSLLDVSDADRPVWRDVTSVGQRPPARYGHCSAVTQNGDGSGWTVYFFGGRALHAGLHASIVHKSRTPVPLDESTVEPADPEGIAAAAAVAAAAAAAGVVAAEASEGAVVASEASEGAVPAEGGEEAVEGRNATPKATLMTQASMEFGPNPLESHGAAALYLDDTVTVAHVTAGGADGAAATVEWSVVQTEGRSPPAREGASMVLVGNKLVVMHGWVGVERAPWVRDFWMLDLSTRAWVSLSFADHFPSGRYGHAMALVDFRQCMPMYATLTDAALAAPGDLEAVAGQRTELVLQARDVRQQLIYRCGEVFQARLRPKAGEAQPPVGTPVVQQAHVRDRGDGTYGVEFTPVVAGVYELDVTDIKGHHLECSPLRVTAVAGPCVTPNCVAVGQGLGTITTGKTTGFTVDTRDAFGNRSMPDGDSWRVTLTGPKVNGETVVEQVEREVDEATGLWTFQYAVSTSGLYRLVVQLNGTHVVGSPFAVVAEPAALCIPQSTCTGEGLAGTWNVGCPARFIINARDEYSNKLRKGGAEFAVRVMTFSRTGQALPESRGRITDLHDGSYECIYTPEHIGMVTLTVNCKDHDEAGNVRYVSVKHSPFEVTVQPDFMCAHMSTCTGPGCEGQLVAGEPTEFDIYAKDKYGNRLILGADCYMIEIAAPHMQTVKHTLTDNNDGTYTVRYTPVYQGRHDIRIWGRERDPKRKGVLGPRVLIQHGDAVFVHCTAADTLARCCTASGDGIVGITTAGKPQTFLITARDRFGNARPTGGDVFDVAIRAGWDVECTVHDNRDGTYLVEYLCGNEDEYTGPTNYVFEITLNGEHIVGSPINHAVVPLVTYAGTTEAVEVPTLLTAGEAAEFLLLAKDTEGRPVPRGLDNFKMTFEGLVGAPADFKSVWGDIKDMKDGKYMVRVVAERSSYYKLNMHISLDEQHIVGSPFEVTVIPSGLFNVGFWNRTFRMVDEGAIGKCTMSGAGLEGAVAGERAELQIITKQVVGEDIPGSLFTLEVRGPELVTGVVEGPIDGHYSASYRATVAGEYTGTVKVGRFALPGCPFQLSIIPDETDPAQCTVDGEGWITCVEGDEASFTVTTHDMHGNVTYRASDHIVATVRGGGKGKGKNAKFQAVELSCGVRDLCDGNYLVSYVAPFEGAFSIKVEIGQSQSGPYTQMAGSPFQVKAQASFRKREAEAKAAAESLAKYKADEKRLGAQLAIANATAAAAKRVPVMSVPTNPLQGQRRNKTGLAALFAKRDPKPAVQSTEPTPNSPPLPGTAEVSSPTDAEGQPGDVRSSSVFKSASRISHDGASVLSPATKAATVGLGKKGLFGLGFWVPPTDDEQGRFNPTLLPSK